jgi:hypothetical protein
MPFSASRSAAACTARRTGLVLVVSLALAASALAAERTPFKANPADQAAAKAGVLQRGDLGAGWSGGATTPDFSTDTGCTDWQPKQSDLLVTGAAASEYRTSGLQISSQVNVLETARMVRLDWQRTVVAARTLGCLRAGVAKAITDPQTKLVSVSKVPFPRVTAQTTAFRVLIDVTHNGSTVRVLSDLVAVGRGRSELTLTTTSAYAARAAVKAAEVRLARTLAARLAG